MTNAPNGGVRRNLTAAPQHEQHHPSETTRVGARERLIRTAYDLFSQRGIRAVGIDEVIGKSGVAKATFYRHFPSKDDLVLAFLQRREQVWTTGVIESESLARSTSAEGRLLAIFDIFHDWFKREDFEACSFINVLLEVGSNTPIGHATIDHLNHVRALVKSFAEDAGLVDTEDFSRKWHILMKGAIIATTMGDPDAAHRAQEMGRWLIAHHRRVVQSTLRLKGDAPGQDDALLELAEQFDDADSILA